MPIYFNSRTREVTIREVTIREVTYGPPSEHSCIWDAGPARDMLAPRPCN